MPFALCVDNGLGVDDHITITSVDDVRVFLLDSLLAQINRPRSSHDWCLGVIILTGYRAAHVSCLHSTAPLNLPDSKVEKLSGF